MRSALFAVAASAAAWCVPLVAARCSNGGDARRPDRRPAEARDDIDTDTTGGSGGEEEEEEEDDAAGAGCCCM
jgi:hypothetical protein